MLAVGSLSLGNTSILNMNSNALIVHNGDPLAIYNWLKRGENQPAFWTGTGITSATARLNSTHLTTLAELLNIKGSSTIYSTFDGQPVSTTDVLVRYTLLGDADLNGVVDANDYTQIDNGFGMGLSSWSNGDFNYDGVVDGSDYSLIDNAFNTQDQITLAAPAAEIAVAVSVPALTTTIQRQMNAVPSSEVFSDDLKIAKIASSIFADSGPVAI